MRRAIHPKALLIACVAVVFWCGSALAIPSLQLDIGGGTYYDDAMGGHTEDTIVAPTPRFELFAYLTPDNDNSLNDSYYLSIAVLPKVASEADLGSFGLGTTTVQVTDDMTYGIPPIESYQAKDPGDLRRHGIFETYFYEKSFKFSDTIYSQAYDTQLLAGQGPQVHSSGDKMYYMGFNIDTSLLDPRYALHFDLYNEKIGKCTSESEDLDVNNFAPFFHDAESLFGGGPLPVPEPATLLLFGAGLIGLGSFARRRALKRNE